MKKFKLLFLTLASFLLVACNKDGKQEEKPQESVESSSVVEDKQESKEESKEESKDDESSSADEASNEDNEVSDDEPGEHDAQIRIFIDGVEKESFVAKDVDGKSLLDVMKSVPKLDFVFNEEEGFIDEIIGQQNEYAYERTWIYLLNDQMSSLGPVSQTLKGGDRVDWHFGTVEDLPVVIIPEEEAE